MIINKNFCDYDTCMAFKEMGYNESSDYTYYNHYRVSNEMLEKHPGLSESEYQDLIIDYGGPYKTEKVYKHYIEPVKAWSRNSMLDDDLGELCSCIHLYDAQEWLRTKKDICIYPVIDKFLDEDGSTLWISYMYIPYIGVRALCKRKTYQEALLEGIKEAVKFINENDERR